MVDKTIGREDLLVIVLVLFFWEIFCIVVHILFILYAHTGSNDWYRSEIAATVINIFNFITIIITAIIYYGDYATAKSRCQVCCIDFNKHLRYLSFLAIIIACLFDLAITIGDATNHLELGIILADIALVCAAASNACLYAIFNKVNLKRRFYICC